MLHRTPIGAAAVALLAVATAAVPPASATAVGVSVAVGQPGFYGRIDVGGVPQPPRLVYAQPIVVESTTAVMAPPIYLRVPPGHTKHWSKHCARYNACARPVYFVQDAWYTSVYAPYYNSRRPATVIAPMPAPFRNTPTHRRHPDTTRCR